MLSISGSPSCRNGRGFLLCHFRFNDNFTHSSSAATLRRDLRRSAERVFRACRETKAKGQVTFIGSRIYKRDISDARLRTIPEALPTQTAL